MTDIVSYVEYFRKIATEHKEINDFFMIDINEILAGLRITIKYPALILENLSGNYLASNLDNPLVIIDGGFLIIDHLKNPDDFQGEIALLDSIMKIGNQVIARMLYDYSRCVPLAVKAIPGYDINSVNYERLGPVFDNDFCIAYSFKLFYLGNFEYDPSKWNES